MSNMLFQIFGAFGIFAVGFLIGACLVIIKWIQDDWVNFQHQLESKVSAAVYEVLDDRLPSPEELEARDTKIRIEL